MSQAQRRRIRPVATWLLTAIVLFAGVAAFAFVLIATDPANDGRADASARPSDAGPTSSGWLLTGKPGEIRMPEGADCAACHVVDGGLIGVRTIPAIGHPVHGWSDCTSCHSDESLVATAPGHVGIHAEQCLVCHTRSSEPAPTPLHPTDPDSDCLGCHGSLAPLPSSMVDRPKTLCWLCHHS